MREIGTKSAEDILENIIQKTAKEKMQINFDEWISEKKLQDEKYGSIKLRTSLTASALRLGSTG